MGSAERIYAALESLPWHERAGRLVHFDIIHSEHRTKSRPLSGGITCYLVGMDVGAGFAVHRALKSTHAIGQAYREICVQQNWHNALVTAHIVADGENALVAPLEAAAVAMGQSFENLPPLHTVLTERELCRQQPDKEAAHGCAGLPPWSGAASGVRH